MTTVWCWCAVKLGYHSLTHLLKMWSKTSKEVSGRCLKGMSLNFFCHHFASTAQYYAVTEPREICSRVVTTLDVQLYAIKLSEFYRYSQRGKNGLEVSWPQFVTSPEGANTGWFWPSAVNTDIQTVLTFVLYLARIICCDLWRFKHHGKTMCCRWMQ